MLYTEGRPFLEVPDKTIQAVYHYRLRPRGQGYDVTAV